MRAVSKLLDYLNTVLDIPTDQEDNICPIVTALTKIVKCERYVRKYIRLQVIIFYFRKMNTFSGLKSVY